MAKALTNKKRLTTRLTNEQCIIIVDALSKYYCECTELGSCPSVENALKDKVGGLIDLFSEKLADAH